VECPIRFTESRTAGREFGSKRGDATTGPTALLVRDDMVATFRNQLGEGS
jgi:hypothetical protein